MAAITIHSDFGAQENTSVTASNFSSYICHEVMGPDASYTAQKPNYIFCFLLFFWTFFYLTHFDFFDYILTIWSFDFLIIPASRNYMFLNHAEPSWISDFCKMHISPFFWVSLNSYLFILFTLLLYFFLGSCFVTTHFVLPLMSLSDKEPIHSPVQIVQIQTTLYLMLSRVQNYRSKDLQVISGNLHLALIVFCLPYN